MFFKGRITIDPAQMTHIHVEKPQSGFRQLLFHMTGGKVGNKKEVETLKAVAIVQTLHHCFSSLGVTNMVRLNHDDLEIYFDKSGKDGDFNLAIDKYVIEIDESMSAYFSTLWMVKEHEDEQFKYLIETSVNRSHKVNEYPIEILVSGMLREFVGQDKETIKEKMKGNFSSQDAYNHFVHSRQHLFESFLSSIAYEIKKYMQIDDVKIQTKKRVLVQREKTGQPARKTETPEYGHTPYPYFGFGEFMLYSFLWSELLFDNHIQIADTEVINEAGDLFADVGAEGLEVGEGTIFDESIPTEDFGASLDGTLDATDRMADGDMVADTGVDGDGWFDSFGGDFDMDLDI